MRMTRCRPVTWSDGHRSCTVMVAHRCRTRFDRIATAVAAWTTCYIIVIVLAAVAGSARGG